MYSDPSGEILEFFFSPLFSTEWGVDIQKFLFPIAIKFELNFGTHQRGIGFIFSAGLPTSLPFSYRENLGATYFFKNYGDYKGWETRRGYEYTYGSLYHKGKTEYSSGKFSQTTGYKKFGLIPSFDGVEVSNDLWGDGGDRYRTSYQKLNLAGVSIGNLIFTGDPGLSDKKGDRWTASEPNSTSGLYYIKGPYGDPDKYRHGVLYIGIGHFKMGFDSEDYRHFFQNIIGHNWISKGSPWFKYTYYTPRPFMQFGGGIW